MKISKQSGSTSYGSTQNYIIFHDEGVQTGLFVRFPIRKIMYEIYPYNSLCTTSLAEFAQNCKDSKLFRLFNYIIGNKDAVKFALDEDLFDDPDLAGLEINRIISPIYFKRNYRSLNIINMDDDSVIEYISSFGYDDEWIQVAGHCNKEITKISHKHKRLKTRIRYGKSYLYTYIHIAKELIKTLESKELFEKKKRGDK